MNTPFFATPENLAAAAMAPDEMCRAAWIFFSRKLSPGAMIALIAQAVDGKTVATIAHELDASIASDSKSQDLTDAQKIGLLCCFEFAVRKYGPKETAP